MNDEQKKGDLIKKALTIVDELADLDMEEILEDNDDLEILIGKAYKLKKDRLWKLN